jgi:Holliday junction resolvasome RuvABC endonuclease subunit
MIDNKNKDMWNNRLEVLRKAVEKNINNIPEKEVTVEQLFYDEV